MLRRRPVRCPQCGERTGVPILYGLPTPGAFDAAARGEIALGGCVIGLDDPNRRCLSCGHSWRQDRLGLRKTPAAGTAVTPPDLPELTGDGEYALACVGESHYVEALYDLGRAYDAEGRPDRIEAENVPVGVAFEPDNPADPNAIRVFDLRTDGTLGYVARRDAAHLRSLLEKRGGAIACRAMIGGPHHGEETPGFWRIGMWLDIPEESP